jgi:hypothetical protein
MRQINLFLLVVFTFSSNVFSQNLATIFTNVDTLYMPGAVPGHLLISNSNVTPIVSISECNNPLDNFAVATSFQNGKVIAVGHESILANNAINQNDNALFLLQAMNWLNSGTKRVKFKQGWINNNNSSIFQSNLINNGYSFSTISGTISAASLLNTDILLFGNDWNNQQAYSVSELTAIQNFVSNGGSVFIAGLGWSWPQTLSLYPMNQVASLFGFEYTTDAIYDAFQNVSGSPKFSNFYPENAVVNPNPYCPSPYLNTNFERGDQLRVLRMAVSTTGEFTQQNGGAAAIPALLDAWLEDINEMYGREFCVRFELIPNNNLLIFPNPATDPWATLPPGSGGCTNAGLILDDQASVIDGIIGAVNYDISHVIAGSPFGGGCAGSLKTGLSGGLDIPVTRHEIGHQLRQDHTINHSDRRNYEPENGAWTMQGGNGQGRAHGVSFHQTAEYLANNIPNVGTNVLTENAIPTINAGLDYIIPISTPFTLTATASDANLNDSLTYVWDNMNPFTMQTIPVANDLQGAIFMRLLPNTESMRTFPKMSSVVANTNSNAQEQLPTQARIMDIRVTVNDNHKMIYNGQTVNASGINSDDVQLTVVNSGPFEVTSQNSNGITYLGGSSQLITWNVNGTNTLPINTQNVSIMLSTDGGFTYPITILQSTPNTGSASVIIPNISTTTARVKVAALGNIYFDINTNNFEIKSTLGTENLDLNSLINVYPNPSKDFFNIDIPENMLYKTQLYSPEGKLISTDFNKNRFDVSTLSNGIYLLVITDLEFNLNYKQKIIVAR